MLALGPRARLHRRRRRARCLWKRPALPVRAGGGLADAHTVPTGSRRETESTFLTGDTRVTCPGRRGAPFPVTPGAKTGS